VQTDIPVLAVSGDLDPITPPRYADAVTREFRNGLHIVVPNRSHNDVDPCITSLFEQFLIAGNAVALDRSCVSQPTHLSFATQLSNAPGR
jgi:pimeloyl-ACP methyl ester carboxylesterase